MTYKDYENVINFFNTNHDNRTGTIAKHFKLKLHDVDIILDDYLSTKSHYMGEIPNKKKKKDHKNNVKIELFEDEISIGIFKSKKDAATFLGLKCIDSRFDDNYTINHYRIGRTITYKRV